MKTSENKVAALVLCITPAATNPNALRPTRSWTSETMACQTVRLASGQIGTGIQPKGPIKILVVHPPEVPLANSLWSEAFRLVDPNQRSTVFERITAKTIASSDRGKRFIDQLKIVVTTCTPDVVIVHSVKHYFCSAAAAGYALRKHFPEIKSSPRVLGGTPAEVPPHNAVVFAPSIIFNGMHNDEGGPVAWTEHFASEANLFHSAILSAGGVGGFFTTAERQRVIIFSSFLPSAFAAQQATCWAARELTPPSLACSAVQLVRWVPIVSSATRADVESLITREAAYWRDEEDYVIVLWRFGQLGITESEAPAFLSRLILGHESVQPTKLA